MIQRNIPVQLYKRKMLYYDTEKHTCRTVYKKKFYTMIQRNIPVELYIRKILHYDTEKHTCTTVYKKNSTLWYRETYLYNCIKEKCYTMIQRNVPVNCIQEKCYTMIQRNIPVNCIQEKCYTMIQRNIPVELYTRKILHYDTEKHTCRNV
jgi:uncharacterized protein YqkB